ncbi:hypothetical protein GGQ91_004859 [Methylobacterium fujisawaense]|uniref:HTH cro/C1-type domain-containing protein n=1 Tax=Methylobacterium fujisawaense TaxID=107400 RepID=A0ABR6DHZ6_9HYPH|nr:hypothetical protein [Methylobacterium fujisawaense]MBA9065442.1 hypothetical protein [Methylobacterium fujisawaense]
MPSSPTFSRSIKPKKRRPSTVTIPERVGPHVKLVFAEMRRQGQTYDAVEAGSGVNRPTIKAWRHKNRPNLDSIEAVLGHLKFEFVPLPTERALPPEIVEALRPIAERLDLTMPEAIRLTAQVAYREHHLKAIRQSDEAPTASGAAG